MRYLVRCLAHALILLAAISVLTFFFVELAPGNYFDEMRLNPQISPETVESLREKYGLDRSLPARYWEWILSVARGEWGFSFANNLPVAPLLWSRAANTLVLTLSATLLAWALAIPLGTWWAAFGERRWWDRLWGFGTAALLSVPEILLALLFLLVALETRAFPSGGMFSVHAAELSTWARLRDLGWHLILPGTVLAVSSLGVLIRHTRASVAEALAAPYVRAVRARGISERRLLFRYVLPVAANPLITLFGFSIGSLLSGSLLVEAVMGWPGLGSLLLEAILARDLYVVIGAVMCSAIFLVAGNLVADVLLYLSDPRIRAE